MEVSKDRSLAFDIKEGVFLMCHVRSSTDEAWGRFIVALKAFIEGGGRSVLVRVSEGAAPTVNQRATLRHGIEGKATRSAVLTDSIMARAAGKAVAWFDPRVRIFARRDTRSALEHVGADVAKVATFDGYLSELEAATNSG